MTLKSVIGRYRVKVPIFKKVTIFVNVYAISYFEACFREKASVNVFLLPNTPGNEVSER